MRLWSIHPAYLDARGLVALWREGLLAQKVLLGKTKGYRHHPQLNRFKACADPMAAIAVYLNHIVDEADNRGYNFDRKKIVKKKYQKTIAVTNGQVTYEFRHLLHKLRNRDSDLYNRLKSVRRIKVHPLFRKVKGGVENWEATE